MNYYKQESLSLAEKIINTYDTTRAEPEYLRSPGDLTTYVQSWNIPLPQAPSEQDLAEVLALRRRLRTVFEAGDMAVVADVLNDLLEGVEVRPHIGLAQNGSIELELDIGQELPLARRLAAQAALDLSTVLQQYGIERFHICNATPCTDVFIDTSRNHTRRYCCEQCANRHNVAAHRQRQKRA